MNAEIFKMLPWTQNMVLQDAHDLMIDMLRGCFKDNGASPALWLIVGPQRREAAVMATPWGNEFEKQAAVATMRAALHDGPGGGVCPMYSFSCEALMKTMRKNEYIPGMRLKDDDPETEDVAFVSSYDSEGAGLFTRFGVRYGGNGRRFGRLMERDDWNLGDSSMADKLDGLLLDLYRDEPPPQIRCPHCHKPTNMHMALRKGRQTPENGDALLCLGCGEVSTFDDTEPHGARKASKAERTEFYSDTRVMIGSMVVKMMQQSKK